MRTMLMTTVLGLVLIAGGAGAQSLPTTAATAATSRSASGPQSRPATLPATLKNAKLLYQQGKYEEAVALYKKLSADPAEALQAAIGLAESYIMIGKYDEALAALRAVAARGETAAAWQTAMASALSQVGKYPEALAAAEKACKARPEWAPAVLAYGQALEMLGKKKEAIEVYKGIDKAISAAQFQRDAEALAATGLVLDRYAILVGQKASDQARNILHNYLQRAQQVDKSYWQANLAAAYFLLSKHKGAEAIKELELAKKLNARLPEVNIAAGFVSLEQWKFEEAIQQADAALAINPKHADALLFKAATLLRWRKYGEVAPVVRKVLRTNPNHLEALSLLAALHVQQRQEEQAQPFIEQAFKINPSYGQLYEMLGDTLSSGRQFPQAEKYYKKAMELAPELAGPVTGLGLLYMQSGQEELAKQTLETAFALDDYRDDVRNYLNLLNRLEKFLVKETDHFIVKVDGATDAVLLDWVAEAAERMYGEVTSDFDYKPTEKTLLEFFPNHLEFSVRISGRGWIPTIGACTGRVIAMPAPDPLRQGRGEFGSFNWATVLRHEFTHAVTLSATANRIPHWFTEACAVWEQPDRRNFQTVALLVDAVRRGKLISIKQLDWGFQRPRTAAERPLAYGQSEWIFEYLVETHKYDVIVKMLAGFRDGMTQPEVFQKILNTNEDEFDKAFLGWAKKQVISWGFDSELVVDVAQATKLANDKPDSADAQGQLAVALMTAMRVKEAEAAAQRALKLDANQKRALTVLGTIRNQEKNHDEALELAGRLEKADPKGPAGARIMAEAYLAKRDWLKAIAPLEQYKQRRQEDSFGYEHLATIYTQLSEMEKALPNLIELHKRTINNATYARKAGDIYRTLNQHERALDLYEQVVQINPYDAGVYKAIASLSLRGSKHDRAILAMRSVTLLEPKDPDSWAQLGAVYYQVGKATKSAQSFSEARQAAQKGLEIDPNSRCREVLQMVEEAMKELPTTRPAE